MLLVLYRFFWWPWWLRIGKAARFEQQVGSDPKGWRSKTSGILSQGEERKFVYLISVHLGYFEDFLGVFIEKERF